MITYTNENNLGSGGDAYRYDEENHAMGNDDDYDISTHCKNYSPRGNSTIMDMSDYSKCDNCRYQRQDNKCGLAQRTLN